MHKEKILDLFNEFTKGRYQEDTDEGFLLSFKVPAFPRNIIAIEILKEEVECDERLYLAEEGSIDILPLLNEFHEFLKPEETWWFVEGEFRIMPRDEKPNF